MTASILDAIGNTPLIRLKRMAAGLKARVLVKAESLNPGGSVKDRVGMRLILEAEKIGLIREGGTIVEPTSGNTGMGLAIAAAIRGYRTIFTMPDKVSREKEDLLRAYGAEVVRTPTNVPPEDPRSYYRVAERIVSETPHSFSPNPHF